MQTEQIQEAVTAPPIKRKAKNKTNTEQIATLQQKLESIRGNHTKAQATLTTYQSELDTVEADAAAAVIAQMTNDCEATQATSQEARINLRVITQRFEQAKNDLQHIPGAVETLTRQIAALRSDLKARRIAHVIGQVDLDKRLVLEAQDALLALMSFRALRADLGMGSMDSMATMRHITSGDHGEEFRLRKNDAFLKMVKVTKWETIK